jgi:hypothetical protein
MKVLSKRSAQMVVVLTLLFFLLQGIRGWDKVQEVVKVPEIVKVDREVPVPVPVTVPEVTYVYREIPVERLVRVECPLPEALIQRDSAGVATPAVQAHVGLNVRHRSVTLTTFNFDEQRYERSVYDVPVPRWGYVGYAEYTHNIAVPPTLGVGLGVRRDNLVVTGGISLTTDGEVNPFVGVRLNLFFR